MDLFPIAVAAARLVDPILKAGGGSAAISGRDIKLAEDRACEQAIRAFLTAQTPYPVLGEEEGWGGGEPAKAGAEPFQAPHWVIDPLDGSFNFYRGLPLFAVSIALCDGPPGAASARLGVIYDPSRGEIIAGGEGRPAQLNGVPVAPLKAGARQMLATGYPTRSDPAAVNARLGEVTRDWTKIRMLGSAALSLGWVSLGRLDGYAEQRIMWWDVAAGLAIARAAGANLRVTPLEGYMVDVEVAA